MTGSSAEGEISLMAEIATTSCTQDPVTVDHAFLIIRNRRRLRQQRQRAVQRSQYCFDEVVGWALVHHPTQT